ncbi:MAG: hypothetical protein WBP45_10315 [Daejeonella sp.]
MKIVEKIINKNLKRKGKHILAISLSLLDVLLEKTKYEAQLTSLSIHKDGFVSVTEIPEDIKEFLGLNYIAKGSVVEEKIPNYSEERFVDWSLFREKKWKGYVDNFSLKLEQAFKFYEPYKCEFIDSFDDQHLINLKARRLSVLLVLRIIRKEKALLEPAYLKLQELDPEFELVSRGLKEFYRELNWYSRIGEVRGCILA